MTLRRLGHSIWTRQICGKRIKLLALQGPCKLNAICGAAAAGGGPMWAVQHKQTQGPKKLRGKEEAPRRAQHQSQQQSRIQNAKLWSSARCEEVEADLQRLVLLLHWIEINSDGLSSMKLGTGHKPGKAWLLSLDHRRGCAIWCAYSDRTAIKMYSTLHSKIVNQTGSADPAQAPGGQYKVWAGRIWGPWSTRARHCVLMNFKPIPPGQGKFESLWKFHIFSYASRNHANLCHIIPHIRTLSQAHLHNCIAKLGDLEVLSACPSNHQSLFVQHISSIFNLLCGWESWMEVILSCTITSPCNNLKHLTLLGMHGCGSAVAWTCSLITRLTRNTRAPHWSGLHDYFYDILCIPLYPLVNFNCHPMCPIL